MNLAKTTFALSLAAAALAACGDDGGQVGKPDCNPLSAGACFVPYPSSVYEVDDAASETGKRLAIPAGALPKNTEGEQTDPTIWNLADGWSPASPIIVAFPGGVSSDGLSPLTNFDASLAPTSSTILFDLTDNKQVAHFAELDEQNPDSPDSQALYLRPAARLIGGHRYVVAITNKVKAKGGGALPISEGFVSLRDGGKTDNPLLEKIRPRYVDIFAALSGLGIAKADLVVAWDFTVASDKFLRADAIAARDRSLMALTGKSLAYEIVSDAPVDDGAVIRRRITGKFETPLFLTNGGKVGTRVILQRDGANLPMTSGFYRAPFTAIVPKCAYTANAPVGMILYGHGLMGESEQVASGSLRRTADALCMVIVGTDMRGMSSPDFGAVARALTNMTFSDEVFEVLLQGMVNHIALTKAMQTTMADTLFVDDPDGPDGAAPKRLVDPNKIYYYGLSQGGIFGTLHMAYNPFITRGVLGVGGANYSLLLERSTDWPTYREILNGAYNDPLDVALAIALFQMRWDKSEGSGVVNSLPAGTGLGVPAKQILMQIAVADDQVPNLGSDWQARSMNLPVLAPAAVSPYGLGKLSGPLTGSAIVYMDGGAPPAPLTNVPAPDTGAHFLTRDQPATLRQMATFYNTGMIVNECRGECRCHLDQCK